MLGFHAKRIVKLGLKSLWVHKLRSTLTVLGIVVGVCSVIAMLAIGEGASMEAQEQIKKLGSHNILVRSVKPPEDESATAERSRVVEYGVTYQDAERMAATIPTIERIAIVRELRKDVWSRDRRADAPVLGTVPELFHTANMAIDRGRFLEGVDLRDARDVCVLGAEITRKLFPLSDPLDETVKVGTNHFRVIGVLREQGAEAGSKAAAVFGDVDESIYLPLPSVKARYGELTVKVSSGSQEMERVQLHRIVVQVRTLDQVIATAAVVKDLLARDHDKDDYEVIVPLQLLRQAERTKRIFRIVLGSIAAMSLLVGGIGVMNIMLASVTERTREIGIRRAMGAKRRNIMTQFLAETVILSAFGGLLGVLIGISIPYFVTRFAGMATVITAWSLGIAFSTSALVGLIFGLYPARRAARMDPIEALRHE